MWENLTRADFEDARAQLAQRRDELLTRQAEEIRGLDAEAAEVATLVHLIGGFVAKFGGHGGASAPAAATGETEAAPAEPADPEPADAEPTAESQPVTATPPAAARPASPGPASRGSDRTASKRNPSQSNFDTFARALSNSI